MAVTAVVLCAAAMEAVKSVGTLADCVLMYNDGSGRKRISVKVSKAVMAAHSKVLGYASCQSLHVATSKLAVHSWPCTAACTAFSGHQHTAAVLMHGARWARQDLNS